MSSDPSWSWCSTGQPPSSNISAGWLPYFYNPSEFIRSGSYSSLGAFRLLHEAISHRAAIAGVVFALPVPPEVVPNAKELWEQYAATLQAVIDASVFVDRCGGVVTGTIDTTWPAGVPGAVDLLSSLRRIPTPNILSVEESLKVASSVRDGDVLGTWPVPRITNDCKRITGVSLGQHSNNVVLPDAVHCGTSTNVEAYYSGQVMLFIPEDGGMKVAIPAGSGNADIIFTLEGLSEVPPNGYENSPPPPNCDYEYFLTTGSRGPVRYDNVLMGFNEKTFQLDGEHLLDVTPWIQAENTVSMSEWAKDGGPGPTGVFSWDEVYISEFLVWNGEGDPPDNLDQRFRPMIPFAEKPWRNSGGNEAVEFVLHGVTEAFRSGPFAPPYGTSIPFPRIDTRPRYADSGDVVKVSFLALSGNSWTVSLTPQGSSETQVGSGSCTSETTELSIPITTQALYYTVSVSDGSTVIKDTIIGAIGRKTCAILSYEPAVTTPEVDDEQPGIIYDGSSYVVSVFSSPFEITELTIYGRFRLPDDGIIDGTQRLMIVSESTDSLNRALVVSAIDGALVIRQYTSGGSVIHESSAPSFAATVGDNIFDLAITRSGSQMKVYLNGAVLATIGSPVWTVWPYYSYFICGGLEGEFDTNFRGRQYRASLFNHALTEELVARLSAHGIDESDRWGSTEVSGALVDIDFITGVGHHFPDRSATLSGADAFGGNIQHIFPITYGLRSVVKMFSYAEISSDPGETWVFDLPPNCSIVRVEYDILYEFSGDLLSVGTLGQPTQFVSDGDATTAGIFVFDSGYTQTLSRTAYTPVYITSSEVSPSSGLLRVRIVWDVRGNVV